MSRASWIVIPLLIVGAAALALFVQPRFSVEGWPVALALPEAVAPAMPPPAAPPAWSALLPGVVALVMFWWRRRARASVGAAAVVAGLLLLHPATATALTLAAGRIDLLALAALLLAGVLLYARRPVALPLALALLLAALLVAPSAAGLVPLGMFLLLEASSAPRTDGSRRSGAGALAVLAGLSALWCVVRACGWLPVGDWLGLPGAGFAVDADLPTVAMQLSAAVWPDRPPLYVPTPLDPRAGFAVVALLGGVTLALGCACRRSLRAPLLATLSLAALAVGVRNGGALAASAILPFAILLAIAIGSLLDVTGRPLWRGVGALAAVLLLVASGSAAWQQRAAFRSPGDLRLAAAPDTSRAPLSHPLRLAALRVRLAQAPVDEVTRLARERSDGAPPDSLAMARIDRDLAVALVRRGQVEPALDLLTRALPLASHSAADDWRFRLDLVDVLMRAGRLDQAVDLAGELAGRADQPEHAEALVRLGMAHAARALLRDTTGDDLPLREREMAEARTQIDAAIAADAGCVRALLDRGRLRLAAGDGTGAVSDLERAAALRPDLAEPHIELAKLWFSREIDDEGEAELLSAQRLAGANHPDVLLLTAQLMLARGDLVGAVSTAERLQARVLELRGGATELAQLFRLLSRAAEDQKELEVVEAMCRLSLHYAVDRSGDVTARLYQLLKGAQRYDDALAVLRAADEHAVPMAELAQELSLTLKNVGLLRLRQGESAAALDAFLESVRRNAEFRDLGSVPSVLRSLADAAGAAQRSALGDQGMRAFQVGKAALEQGRLDDALRCFTASTELVPLMPFSHLFRAQVLIELGRDDDAITSLQTAVRAATEVAMPELAERAQALLDRLQAPPP